MENNREIGLYFTVSKTFPFSKREQQWILIIGGGLLQVPVVYESKNLRLKTIVTDLSLDCPCRYICDYFLPIDVFDIQQHVQLVLVLKRFKVNLAGIIVAGIDAAVTGAIAARVAGLTGVDPLAAFTCKHKPAMRRVFEKVGIPVPKWQEVSSEKDIKEAIKRIGFPCIIKNTDNSASRGTRKFFQEPNDKMALIRAVENAKSMSMSKTALIEELWQGSEQTVETIFDINGKFWPCFITDRIFKKRSLYALETGLRHPTILSKKIQQHLYEMVNSAANILGIKVGAAKADTMLTKDGPRILEMTTRLSGGFDCQYLVPAATGKNVIRAAILTALGCPIDPDDLIDHRHKFAVSDSVWPSPGKIKKIYGLRETRKYPGIEAIFIRCKVGDNVQSYDDCARRICFVIASGETRQKAKESLKKALSKIRIETL